MEISSNDNLQQPPISSNDTGPCHNDKIADDLNNSDSEPKHDISMEDVRHILEVIAVNGRFWNDWDKLQGMLLVQLKQVLSDYPEAKMTREQQYDSLGESYVELVNRLEEALLCFTEGPPFTLQRLCEILLDAKTMYPKLSKLALALEKNLLVTSTLTISTDPYPQTTVQEGPVDEDKASEKEKELSSSAENGIEAPVADKDEVMTDADVGEDMTIDMEAFEDIVRPSETSAEPSANV